jgi:ribonuclease PH
MLRRFDDREFDELRDISMIRNYLDWADGSVYIKFGKTWVLCSASIENRVPRFLLNSGQGWVTAEYNMMPNSTQTRTRRDRFQVPGRTYEIQRLIGRSLRAVVDLNAMPNYTIYLDCDVIQADGGTRTASITGAFVALYDAVQKLKEQNPHIKKPVIKNFLAAISVGMIQNTPLLDLDYQEDSNADVDMNVVMSDEARIIEIQGTGEEDTFSVEEMLKMVEYARRGILELIDFQREVLELKK